MDKLLFKRVLISILLVCMLSYVVYLFVGLNQSNGSLQTENAVYASVSDTINTEGFVIRNEVLIKNKNKNVISYNVEDGENLSVGQNIADIYGAESDSVSRKKIKEIDNKIAALDKLGNSYFKESVGLDTVNNQIDNSILSMLGNINSENYNLANKNGNDLLFFINERQIITGSVENFNDKISALKQEKSLLESQCSNKIGSIVSDNAGYFITNIDGYENCFNYDDVTNITLEDFDAVSHRKQKNSFIGKVVIDPEWYLACKIDKDDALALSKMQGQGLDVHVSIPFITNEKIPAEIVSVNQKTRQDDGILILSCNYMNEDISKARIENVEIETSFHEGLKVSKRAIYEDYVKKTVKKDGKTVEKRKLVQGVYVLHGTELIFKQISIDYSDKNFVICDPNPEEGALFNGTTIKLYDRVVIKGDNLYDGKIIK